MVDVHNRQVRSFNMSQIKSKDTKPEMIIRRFLHSNGFRYRLYERKIVGCPDMVLPKFKTLIFINGCFWHGHIGCKYFVIPKTRTQWWLEKINKTRLRDDQTKSILLNENWNIITIWECELKNDKRKNTLNSLMAKIQSSRHT